MAGIASNNAQPIRIRLRQVLQSGDLLKILPARRCEFENSFLTFGMLKCSTIKTASKEPFVSSFC